jgi:hypothetical protein
MESTPEYSEYTIVLVVVAVVQIHRDCIPLDSRDSLVGFSHELGVKRQTYYYLVGISCSTSTTSSQINQTRIVLLLVPGTGTGTNTGSTDNTGTLY